MVGEIELETLYGACRYCGEQRIVNAADQQDADNKATNDCVCPDAMFHRKKRQIEERLRSICCGEEAKAGNFMAYDNDQLTAVMQLAELVQRGKIASVQITAADSVLKLSITSDQAVKFSRNRKEEIEAEV